MDVAIVPLRNREADVDVPAGILVGVLVPGQPADDLAAFLDRFLHQFGAPGSRTIPSCGKGDDLDLAVRLHLVAGEQQAACRAQPADRAHIGEQAEERGAIHDADFDGPDGARRDLVGIVFALEVVGDLDGLRQRAGLVGPHDFAKQAFVGVEMQIEQTRKDQTAGRVNFLLGLIRQIGTNRRNAFALDGDIDELGMPANPGIADA